MYVKTISWQKISMLSSFIVTMMNSMTNKVDNII
jgi:hypothetical protein